MELSMTAQVVLIKNALHSCNLILAQAHVLFGNFTYFLTEFKMGNF